METALTCAERLGPLIEYYEDPVDGLEAMAELHRRTGLPLATNMVVVATYWLSYSYVMDPRRFNEPEIVGAAVQRGCYQVMALTAPYLEGDVEHNDYILSDEELDQGYILACQSVPRSDIRIAVPMADGPAARTISGRVVARELLTHDIVELRIQLDDSLRYKPGQFAELALQSLGKDRIIADGQSIVDRAPDIIIGSWCGKKFRPEKVAARAGWQDVPAVRHQQLFEIKSADILQPGPAALTDGVEQMHRIVRQWMLQHG